MNFYKFSKVSIFLITGILLACSPEKPNSTVNTESQAYSATPATNNAEHKTTQGLKVYVDPDTGKFLDSPPTKPDATDNQKLPENQTNIDLNSKNKNKASKEQKESTTPGGGTYIKMPPP